jgi:triphosphoribosyl-dephospho-CoA synthase
MRTTATRQLAVRASAALLAEAELTPKPALVDRRGSGAHADLTLALMRRSARALRPAFAALAHAADGSAPSTALRESLGAIGRAGERTMLAATGGVNTHRGALWSLGLLVAAAAICGPDAEARTIAAVAGDLARRPDRFAPRETTHGVLAAARYGVGGARGEARAGFPHVLDVGLPALRGALRRGLSPRTAACDALIAIVAELEDTCVLHRGGLGALRAAQRNARAVLAAGGTATAAGRRAFGVLEADLVARNASPGGSADLLAATLFLWEHETR